MFFLLFLKFVFQLRFFSFFVLRVVQVYGASGAPKEGFLRTVFANKRILRDKVAPSFLLTCLAFRFDFQGLWLLGFQKRENHPELIIVLM